MAVTNIVIDDGSLEYEIQNKQGIVIGKFRINPADPELIPRTEAIIERFNSLSYPETQTEAEMTETVKAFTGEVHGFLNTLLGYTASEELFSGCGALAIVPDGDFYFEKVLAHILDIVQDVTKLRINKKLEKVRKATAKYRSE